MNSDLNINPADIQRLTPADQRDLQQFVENEAQKSQVQSTIHELTDMCFKKCIPTGISSGKLASKESSCMSNCVDRFLDSNVAVLRHLESMRRAQ